MKSYRNCRSVNPMSDWGHAIFADNFSSISCYGGKNKTTFYVESADLVDVLDIRAEIIQQKEAFSPDECYFLDEEEIAEIENLFSLSDDNFFSMFNPSDIVMSAEAYDNYSLLSWLYNTVIEPMEIGGVKTADGAVTFNPEIIKTF